MDGTHGSPSQTEFGPAGDSAGCDSRRDFLGAASSMAMTVGLVSSYGYLGVLAGKYLYGSGAGGLAWVFVAEAERIKPGESLTFRAPSGLDIVIRRGDARRDGPPTAEDFLALSSTCPHLGCRVHWEQPNNRFFCPCHNGSFDPEGKATGGPPAAANQSLPQYPLKVEYGLVYIEVPVTVVGGKQNSVS